MQVNTAKATMTAWTNGNISRFVNDAVSRDLDTISLRSSKDAETEDVWLPACDHPLKISLTKPILDVTIFKRQLTK
jgi:hypothetical protein